MCVQFFSPFPYPSRKLSVFKMEFGRSKGVITEVRFCFFYIKKMYLYCIMFKNCLSETGLSMPSDTSLSPASQNSPYCMTPVSQGSPASSGIGSPMASSAITKIHSKRFRE